ncbi:unnamed protein product [Acanthoscelides obtectus]|uniref:Golgi integral membrane protein 4 n=1 Tax=Acanthoscelides obtectus TaxID=200917 RepID=A0A9P0JIB4_ACAOB|nr:unnamed protein product [Acanthoscelides obtectus]CAK1649970.1 Golgi integral membrane protein 4 [Acanthoscelides obtectus]
MTASRIIRGTRAKIVLYVCGIFIVTAIIACYNNTLSQLDDVRRSNEICHQQEENLGTQLQVISDYKVRIEKSLKAEKTDHQQTKLTLEAQLNEERTKNEKSFGDVKIKFSSLQQHYNILQTEHEDYKEECSKTQQKQQEEINDLQSKIEELKEEIKKIKASKESLKTEYIELQVQKENIDKQLKQSNSNKNENESQILHLTKENEDLKQELQQLKEKCSFQDTIQEPRAMDDTSSTKPKLSSAADSNNNFFNKNNVLKQPSSSQANIASSKSSTKSGFQNSPGALDNAKPLLVPTVTPDSLKPKVLPAPDTKKLPEGVVAFPEKKSEEPQVEINNNRYQNVNQAAVEHKEPAKDDADHGAHEVFDPPQNHLEGIGFGEAGENQMSNGENVKKLQVGLEKEQNKEKKNQDNDQQDYKELENEEDDDAEGYEDHLARQKDPAVRN